jgi:hypothetical protein
LPGEIINPLNQSVFNHSAAADSSRDSAAWARSTQNLATAAETTAAELFVSSGPKSEGERKYKNSIHTFVISWFGKHENAESIVKAVTQTSTYVSVIYSDPNINVLPQFSCQAIRRPNDLFFADKFRACLESCDADILLLIHADCDCDNWSEIPERCRLAIEENPDIGVWSPLIDFTDWGLDRTEIKKIPESSLSIVVQTDAVVFGLTRVVADRMRKANFRKNIYGWGTDLMFNYYTYSLGEISVVDRNLLVRHPLGSKYSIEVATAQLIEFLKQLTPAEKAQSALLDAVVRLHERIREAGTKDPAAVAQAKRELAQLRQRILGEENHVNESMLTRSSETARFWCVDLWGDGWDRHRRRLLFKHFRAYLLRPYVPAEYLPVAPASKEARSRTGAQAEFSAAYLKRILAVQAGSGSTRRVYLTYRPLGKNLRLLGTAIRENVDLGRRVQVAADGPPSERKALATQGREWSPWVWARSPDGTKAGASHDAAQAWNELFQNPPATSGGAAAIAARRLAHPAFSEPPFSAGLTERILKLAAATCYVFTPTQPISDCIRELKAQMNWPDPSERPVLGIHIRRGDAASADAAASVPTKSTRRSFALESYLDTADMMCERYGIRDIFLGTESRAEIDRAIRLRPAYRFLTLDYDRSIFPNISTSNQFIEDFALDNPEFAKKLAVSAILDLAFFCECHAFIGAFNSEFSVLAWLLTVGSRGHLVPYVSLSRPAAGRSLNPFSALLNLRNNCPLELYHW